MRILFLSGPKSLSKLKTRKGERRIDAFSTSQSHPKRILYWSARKACLMKFIVVLAVGICLLLSSVPAMAEQAADEAAIRKAMEQNFATWNAKDVKSHVALYSEVAVPWEYAGRGDLEGVEKYLTSVFMKQKDAKAKITQEIGIVFVTPDVAIYKAYAERTGMVNGDGKVMPPSKGLGAWILVKKGGVWLFAASFHRPIEE